MNQPQYSPVKGLIGTFYNHDTIVVNPTTEEEETKSVLFCEITAIGSTNSSFSQNCSDQKMLDKMTQQYPSAWRAFNDSGEGYIEGTPLKLMPGITRSLIKNLSIINVNSIEDLAELPDSACQNLRDGFRQQKIAIKYLKMMEEIEAEDTRQSKESIEAVVSPIVDMVKTDEVNTPDIVEPKKPKKKKAK